MTNKEAISVLSEEADYLYGADYPHNRQAFELAIAAIEKVDAITKELTDLKTQWDMYGGEVGITAAFKALERDRWIPCEERLPETWEPVYAAVRSEGREDWVIEVDAYDPYLTCPWGNIPMIERGKAEVYAWMPRPLPEPPKEEKS